MPRLAPATQDQVESIYRESHSLWGAGLTLADYRRLWDEISRLPWAVRHAKFLVWLGAGGELLSSLKLYRPLVRLNQAVSRASVLGAIFTPQARRGRGHASAMLRAALGEARRRDDPIALLFSDIGAGFYERFGFRALPALEHWGRIPREAGPSLADWELRDAEEADLAEIRNAHHASCLRRPLAVIRDEEHWEFLRDRTSRFFSRLNDPEVRPCLRVATRRDRFAGYLVTVEGRGEWGVREAGAAEGNPDLLAQLFRAGAGGAREAGLRRFCGWLPPELLPRLEGWRIDSQPRRRALPMVLPLDPSIDLVPLLDLRRGFVPFQDQF